MKKIFYILASAIVALGAVACENDGLDNIGLEVNGDTVSFIASIDNNRTALDGLDTVWDEDDTIVVEWNGTKYNFTNAGAKNKNIFSCSADGLSAIVNAEITATYANYYDDEGNGYIDSNADTAGALLTYTGPFEDIEFAVENAFLKFAAEEGAKVTLTASAEIFRTQQLGLVKTVTLDAKGAEQYVAVLPKTTTITYALNGTDYGVSQENTLVAGKIYPLGDLEVPGWNLVTNASELAVGDKIIIAASAYNFAISTTQNNNNRGQAAIIKSNDKSTLSSDVQIITLAEGKKANTWALGTDAGYLYAASSSDNYLRSEKTLSENSSWTIAIEEGIATIVAQGSNSRNHMQYNPSSFLFSCYASASQKALAIYKYSGKGTPIATKLEMSDDITCTAQTENTLTFTWGAVANALGYEVTINNKTETVTTTPYTAKGLTEKTEYTISVKAIGDGTFYTTSEAKEGKGTTTEKQQQPEGGEVTATITFDNTTKRTEYSSSKQVWVENGITVTNDGGSVGDYYNPARFYKNTTVKIEAPGKISTIVFSSPSGTESKYLLNLSDDTGYTVSGSASTTVTVTLTTPSETFLFVNSVQQARFSSITVTYTTGGNAGGETPEPDEPETPEPEAIEISVEENVNIAAAEGDDTIPVTVTNGEGYEFAVTTTADWIEVEWDNGVYYSAYENTTASTREATVIIIATLDGQENVTKEFTITQAAAEVVEPEQPEGPTIILSEQFDNTSKSDSNQDITVTTFSNFSGSTSKAYKSQYGGIKLGSSKAVGYITSKALDLSSKFTVQIDACKYSSDSGNIVVTVGSQTKTINNSALGAQGTFKTFTLEFDADTSNSTVKIATSAKRAYIDNVVITRN